jgi:hypothetical protein
VLSSVPASNFRFLPPADFREIVTYIAAWAVLGLGSIPSQDGRRVVNPKPCVLVRAPGFWPLLEKVEQDRSIVGALLSMVLGMLTWIIFEFCETTWPSLVPATLVSMAAMVAGSFLWPKKSEYDHDRTQSFE